MYSFDVFDTVITRTTVTPSGIFALMQEELQNNQIYQDINEFVRNNFFNIRKYAEMHAIYNFRKNGIEEITIQEIYASIKDNGCISDDDIKRLLELEINTEIENTVGIKENIEKIKELVSKDERVVLISDMYLDKATIRAMLLKADDIFRDIPLYVSSEYKKCKWSGNFYAIVKEKEKADTESWIHIGDNFDYDVVRAREFGIHGDLFQYITLKQYEKDALVKYEKDAAVQIFIGAAKNARLTCRNLDKSFEIGESFSGVVLFPYVWWLIKLSLTKNIKRLYFIARDGYILKCISDIIIKTYNYDIKTYYIYGSRRAWRMPSVSINNNNVKKLIECSYFTNVLTVRDLAELLEIKVSEVYEFFGVLRYILPDENIVPVIRNYIKTEIEVREDEMVRLLSEKHAEKKEKVIGYLKQELDLHDDAFAFVEMAGSGLTQGCLAELLRGIYDRPIRTFYYKRDWVKVPDNCKFYNFFPSLMKNHIIVETFTRAPHGQTTGYYSDGDKYFPIVETEEGEAIIRHGFYSYLSGIEEFVNMLLKSVKNKKYIFNTIDLTVDYLNYVMKTPDQELMDYFGSMPNKVTGREDYIVEFAPVLSVKDVRNIYLLRNYEPLETYYKGTDLDFSLMRSGENIRKKIQKYMKMRTTFWGKILRNLYANAKINTEYNDLPESLLRGRTVIYAAGKFGQALYKKASKLGTVVLWVDNNFIEYQKKNMPVYSIERIKEESYDVVFIAIKSETESIKIRLKLVEMGVPADKILWINFMVS